MTNKLQLAVGELVGACAQRSYKHNGGDDDDAEEYENTAVHLDEGEQSDLEGERLNMLYTHLSIVRRVYTGHAREENEEVLYGLIFFLFLLYFFKC